MNIHSRRKWTNRIALSLSMGAMAFGLFWLIWILLTVLGRGAGALSPTLFTMMTPPPGTEGGLANAIFGSVVMVVLATFIGTPIGVLTGVFLAEYGNRSYIAEVTRFINDLLLSAPSIVIGLFMYEIYVRRHGGYAALAGVFSLALIVVPIVVRTTENMLQLIPNTLREAAFALGAERWRVIMAITVRAARSGIITGVLLAVARIAGETAPLLFTVTSNPFWSMDLGKPMANLPVTISQFAMNPDRGWQKLAWAAVFLITVGVLIINVLARTMLAKKTER